MKTTLCLFAFLLINVSLKSFSQTTEVKMIRDTKNLEGFRILKVYGDLHVILMEGDQPGITVAGEQKSCSGIEIKQSGDELILSRKKSVRTTNPAIIYITVTELRELDVMENATVSSSNELLGDLLWVKLAGNGDVNVRAGSKKVLTTSWANGKIVVQGNYNASSTFRSDEGHLVTSYRNQ